MQTHKNLASGKKSGKTLAIMHSEQAQSRRCGKEKAGDAFTSLSVMNRRRAGPSRKNTTILGLNPIF